MNKLKRIAIEFGIKQQMLNNLTKNNLVTCKDILSKTSLELMKITGESLAAIEHLMSICSQSTIPPVMTAKRLLDLRTNTRCNFLSTSLDDLDLVLHGGLLYGSISEIAGPSGCGKTQFCLMLSAITSSQSQSSVIYIDTESAFSAERLKQMIRSRNRDMDEEKTRGCLSRVLVHNEHTCKDLHSRLEALESEIIERNTTLVIIDSIASLVRKEYRSNSRKAMTDRTNFLSASAALLKYISEALNVVVVVTNQITTYFSSPSLPSQPDNLDSSYVTTALGNTWSHCVNTRLILQYHSHHTRQVLTAKSPIAPFTAFLFEICDSGLKLIEDRGCHYEGTDPGIQRIKVRSALSLPSQI